MLLDHDDSYWNTWWRLGIPHFEKSSSLQISWTFARFSMWLSPTRLCLVGSIPTPLKNMASSVGVTIPQCMESHKIHVPNHQPVVHSNLPKVHCPLNFTNFTNGLVSPTPPLETIVVTPKMVLFSVFVSLQRRKNKRKFTQNFTIIHLENATWPYKVGPPSYKMVYKPH